MKNKQVKTSNAQRGFAMLEVMLAVVIIAIASFGIYKLFSQSTDRSNADTIETSIHQVAAAVNQFATAKAAAPAGLDDLIGYVNSDLLNCSGSAGGDTCTGIKSYYGDISFTKGTDPTVFNEFSLTLPAKVPANVANQIKADLSPLAKGEMKDSQLTLTFPAS